MNDRSRALVLRADRQPVSGVDDPGPHQLYRHPRIGIEERTLGPVAAGTLRVDMIYAGICGTDLHSTHAHPETGYVTGSAPLEIGASGRVLGHEGVGRVAEVGAGVTYVRPGDLVTFESILRCHHCGPCLRGNFNQCEKAVLIGMQQDGLFATRVDLPAMLAHPVNDLGEHPGGLHAAACVEPAACGLVACTAARVVPGDSVVVFGAGPIGLFTAMLCRLVLGASSVDVVEPQPFRRDLAKPWADNVLDVEDFFGDLNGPRYDVAVETSGVLDNVDRVLPRVAPNGRVALLARSGQPLALRDVDVVITRQISILGSRGHLGGAFDEVLRLIRAGRLPLHEGVTEIVEGLDPLVHRLGSPESVVEHQGKVLVRLDGNPEG